MNLRWCEMLFLSPAEQRQRQEDGHQKLTTRTQTTRIKCSISVILRILQVEDLRRLVMHFKDFWRTSLALPGLFKELYLFFLLFISLYKNFFTFKGVFKLVWNTSKKFNSTFKELSHAYQDHEEPFYNTYKRLFTVLFKGSVTLCSESKELMAHDRNNTQNLWRTNLYSSKAVLLMCKLKYKCIFMWHNII